MTLAVYADEMSTAGGPGEGAASLTIEQVAAGAGIPVSTVRMYQHRGPAGAAGEAGEGRLLRARPRGPPGPDRRAPGAGLLARRHQGARRRVGRGTEPRRRARAVRRSRHLGGRGADRGRPRRSGLPLRRRRHHPGAPATGEPSSGLVEVTDDGRLRVASPRFLEIGTRLGALGIPTAEIIDEYEALRAATDAIADRFTAAVRAPDVGADGGRRRSPPPTSAGSPRRSSSSANSARRWSTSRWRRPCSVGPRSSSTSRPPSSPPARPGRDRRGRRRRPIEPSAVEATERRPRAPTPRRSAR